MVSLLEMNARQSAWSAASTEAPRVLEKGEKAPPIPPPRARIRISRARARNGMLATALLLSLGLGAATWSSWRDAEKLRSALRQSSLPRPQLPEPRPGSLKASWPPPAPPATDASLDPFASAFEIDPALAASLVDRSRRNFALGFGAATVLAAVAVVLWRRAQREETLAEEHARRDRLAALETMSAVLAHEINNPLAALKGNAQLVAEELRQGSLQRAQADRVIEASIRLERLVADLLRFVRGGGPISRALVDPAEILFLAVEDAAPRAELDLEAAPPSWSLDAARIRQALENLLRNAAQAAEGGRVFASVSVEGDRLVYAVRDEGPGLPEGPGESIFEPFFTTKTRGIGLGLTVARRIAELHGGELTARSRPEGGAEFHVVIPRH